MALTGRQKAAMLLMNLDIPSAVQLLEGLEPEVIQEVVLELAYLDMERYSDVEEESRAIGEAFYNALQAGKGFHLKTFMRELLEGTVGRQKAELFHSQIKKAAKKRDPFVNIRLATVDELVSVLQDKIPQVVAIVLSELPPRPKKSEEILSLLDEKLRFDTVWHMLHLKQVGPDVRRRVAETITEELKTSEGEIIPEREEQALRRLALLLGGMKRKMRDVLLDKINARDNKMFTAIRNLMLTWEDIPRISARGLQDVLRSVEPGKLAVALYGADEQIIQKIRSNISERAAAMLDEEISLMQEPLEKEVLDAKEEVVGPLRDANEQGTLRMVGR